MAKSVLLKFVSRILPRAIFTTATTSTRVGLVAPVVRDEITGEYTIQAGAYMLASGGILCLDEISELSSEDFKYFNEAMEDGEAHITKAGLNITVKTRCGLLAACNPTHGSFDMGANLADQVKIPDPTLSRFDLKILYTDKYDDEKDGIMVDHIADSYMNSNEDSTHISLEMLSKYVAYGRRINPVLKKEAVKTINDYYRSIRKDSVGMMKVTTRQVTAIIRLAEAHARMRLSTEVTVTDAEEAIWVFDKALRSVAGDGDGHIDMAKVERKHKFGLVDTILKVIKNGTDGKASEGEILMETAKHKYESEKVCRVIRELCNEGKIMQPKNGIYKVL
jgi:replicative DNA helicase Mcm